MGRAILEMGNFSHITFSRFCKIFSLLTHAGFFPLQNINPLYAGGLFHCYILYESFCHFRGVRSILSLLFYFLCKSLLANNADPDQMPHYVASDQGLHCLHDPFTSLQVLMG